MIYETHTIKNTVGRPAIPVIYTDVIYHLKEYTVGCIQNIHKEIYFVIDKEDRDKVSQLHWHLQTNSYIASQVQIEDKKKMLYLHNLIMRRENVFPGKGAKESVDHINRNGFDNRKENLRILTQTAQNINQKKRERNITLPEGCDIDPEEIPRHIWYIKAHGAHGDRFAIEFKTEGICWKTRSSRKISLKDKLAQAKEKLQEFYMQFPHLNPFNTETNKKEIELQRSFEEILKLAHIH